MTSTSVKDVGSLLNFVGTQAVSSVKAAAQESFGDVMNKASYTGTGQNQSGDVKETAKSKASPKNEMTASNSRKESVKTESSKSNAKPKETTPEVTPEQEQALEEAGSEMVSYTAQELSVSEEEVTSAMEELGLDALSLLDTDNLKELVLTISGEDNSLALLTDAGLYETLQDLSKDLDMVMENLSEVFPDSEELTQAITLLSEGNESGTAVIAQAEQALTAPEETPAPTVNAPENKVSITVEESTQSVKLSTDENGNVLNVETVTPKEKPSEDGSSGKKENAGQHEEKQSFESVNPLQEKLTGSEPQNVDASFEQTAAAQDDRTQEIMDQILDYMKVQLKPEMDQLEMQLHPESLGTLRIQLTAREGEVTAQFHVQNESVKAAIEGQLTILKDTLKEQGVKVEAVEVTVESHAFESNLWQGQERNTGESYQGNKKTPRRINLNSLDEEGLEAADEEERLAAEIMKANGGTVDYTA